MNDPKNRFSRNAKKQPKVDPATHEMPLSQRMTKFRTADDATTIPESGNIWKARAGQLEREKPVAVEKPNVQRTAAGTIETPELTAARLREKARREALKQKAATLAQTVQFIPEDFTATLAGWLFVHAIDNGGDFDATPFNTENLTRCVHHQVMSGQPGWTKFGISELDAAHVFLKLNGYYESSTQKRAIHPAIGRAAREYPVYEPEEKAEPAVASGNRPVFIRRDSADDKNARMLSFDELKAAAQKTFRSDTRGRTTGI